MWTRTHSIVTKEVTKEQLWRLFSDVNNWHTWDKGIEFTRMEGAFEKGTHFTLRPKGGPTVDIELLEVTKNTSFTDVTRFPLARMYNAHQFEDTADGLKITYTVTVEGLLGFLWVKIIAQKIADALPLDTQEQIRAAKKL